MNPNSPHGSARATADARNQDIVDRLTREMEDFTTDFKTEEYLFSPVKIKPAHQAIDLPNVGSVKLPKLPLTLQEPRDMNKWLHAIKLILVEQHLEHLIDIAVPRPPYSHPDALKWQNLSRQVQAWLRESIEAPIEPHIMKRNPRFELADEFLEDVKKAVDEFRIHWDKEALLELLRHQRSKCDSARAFIGSLSLMYRNLWVPVPPHIVIFIMLKELTEEMPTRTTMILSDLVDRGSYQTLTAKDFERVCEFLLRGL